MKVNRSKLETDICDFISIFKSCVKEVDEQMLGIQNKNSSYFVEWSVALFSKSVRNCCHH